MKILLKKTPGRNVFEDRNSNHGKDDKKCRYRHFGTDCNSRYII